jgi:hypothetical protein
MNLKRFATASAVALSLFAVIPSATSSAGGGGGGTVAGPCGTLTSVTASPVTLTAGSGGYVASPLSLGGALKNCSIYIQRYWVDFSEPARPVPAGFNTDVVVTCTAYSRLILNDYISSGSSLGFRTSTNITPTPVVDPSTCIGLHTVKVELKSRTDGRLLSTLSVNYTVTKK